MKLDIRYFHDTDTLFLWNGRPASEGGDLIATGARIPSRIPRNGEDNAVYRKYHRGLRRGRQSCGLHNRACRGSDALSYEKMGAYPTNLSLREYTQVIIVLFR